MTLPVNAFSFHEVFELLFIIDGTKNVSALSVSISNTLFESCTTFLSPIASSSFCFHSLRACGVSAKTVYRPPKRPLWWIVHGNTSRESVADSGDVAAPVGVPVSPACRSDRPRRRMLFPRWVGGSVKFARVNRSNGIGYKTGVLTPATLRKPHGTHLHVCRRGTWSHRPFLSA